MVVVHLGAEVLLALGLEAAVKAAAGSTAGACSAGRLRTAAGRGPGRCRLGRRRGLGRCGRVATTAVAGARNTLGVPVTGGRCQMPFRL